MYTLTPRKIAHTRESHGVRHVFSVDIAQNRKSVASTASPGPRSLTRTLVRLKLRSTKDLETFLVQYYDRVVSIRFLSPSSVVKVIVGYSRGLES